jgi:hypothetical protein
MSFLLALRQLLGVLQEADPDRLRMDWNVAPPGRALDAEVIGVRDAEAPENRATPLHQ